MPLCLPLINSYYFSLHSISEHFTLFFHKSAEIIFLFVIFMVITKLFFALALQLIRLTVQLKEKITKDFNHLIFCIYLLLWRSSTFTRRSFSLIKSPPLNYWYHWCPPHFCFLWTYQSRAWCGSLRGLCQPISAVQMSFIAWKDLNMCEMVFFKREACEKACCHHVSLYLLLQSRLNWIWLGVWGLPAGGRRGDIF